MAELLSDKLRKQIEDSPYDDDILAGLYDKIKNMSDSDLREYLWSNRGYYGKTIGAAVNDIPDLKEYTTVKPNFGNKDIDLKKAFNDENILDKFNDLSFEDIDYVARKNGMTGKDLLAQMSKEKIASDRSKIAKGEDKGGWFDSPEAFAHNLGGAILGTFGKRQQEAIERGEDPSVKDIAGDAGEQLLYAMPWGKVAKVGKGVGQALKLGSNAITPVATEAYDAVVYDEDNPRGEFNVGDVATGTITNMAGPEVVKSTAGRIGTRTGKSGLAKKIENFAEGTSKEEMEKILQTKNYTPQSRIKANNTRLNNPETNWNMSANDIKSGSGYEQLSKERFEELRKKLKNQNNVKITDTKDLEDIAKDPYLYQFLPGEMKKLKTDKQLIKEEAVKNYLTNRAGDKLYQQGKVSIPVVGDYLEKALEDKRKKEEQNKLEKEAEEKWKIKF